MEKVFLKMNNNDKYLSIGNLFRIIKLYSVNKKLVGQADLFCILFGLDGVSESTVNNYCIGARRIADDYKDVYIKKVNSVSKANEKNERIDNQIVERILVTCV